MTAIFRNRLLSSSSRAAILLQGSNSSFASAQFPSPCSAFHTSAVTMVKVGDSIPDLDVLTENSPGTKINLSHELTGNGIIIGVPAAFSPTCSASHVPGYISSPKIKNAGKVFVVSVNDPFVMKAWGESLEKENGKNSVRFLGDPTAAFTKALDLDFDASAVFGGPRSKRYALVVEDGKVAKVAVEKDNTGLDVSTAEKVLA